MASTRERIRSFKNSAPFICGRMTPGAALRATSPCVRPPATTSPFWTMTMCGSRPICVRNWRCWMRAPDMEAAVGQVVYTDHELNPYGEPVPGSHQGEGDDMLRNMLGEWFPQLGAVVARASALKLAGEFDEALLGGPGPRLALAHCAQAKARFLRSAEHSVSRPPRWILRRPQPEPRPLRAQDFFAARASKVENLALSHRVLQRLCALAFALLRLLLMRRRRTRRERRSHRRAGCGLPRRVSHPNARDAGTCWKTAHCGAASVSSSGRDAAGELRARTTEPASKHHALGALNGRFTC